MTYLQGMILLNAVNKKKELQVGCCKLQVENRGLYGVTGLVILETVS